MKACSSATTPKATLRALRRGAVRETGEHRVLVDGDDLDRVAELRLDQLRGDLRVERGGRPRFATMLMVSPPPPAAAVVSVPPSAASVVAATVAGCLGRGSAAVVATCGQQQRQADISIQIRFFMVLPGLPADDAHGRGRWYITDVAVTKGL